MAVVAYPSWAYNSVGQASQIVASATAFAALKPPGSWALTPYFIPPSSVPVDPGLPDISTRLQQILIEMRVLNLQIQDGLNLADDQSTVLRADILNNDSGLTT